MWVRQETKKDGETIRCFGHWWQCVFSFSVSRTFFVRKRSLPFVIGTISSHPSFHQFASMHAIIIPPPSIATIMPMSCPQQKPVLGIRRITSIVLLDVLSSCGTLAHCRNLLFHIHKFADSAFLRASSEPIAIMKAHAPQLPFRKVHFLEQQQLRMNDYFSPRRGDVDPTARQHKFLQVNITNIKTAEDGCFQVFRQHRDASVKMTLDWFDFSVEHLSKWWKVAGMHF
jgi:hypothetical protein